MKSHPRTLYWLISPFLRLRLEWLIGLFLLTLVLLSVVSSLLHAIGPGFTFAKFWSGIPQHLLLLLDLGNLPDGAGFFASLASGIFKVALLIIVLGIVVSKFLVLADVFVAREKASIHRVSGKKHKWELALRIYNATRFEIVDIEFEVFLRVPQYDAKTKSGRVPNSRIKIIDGRDHWPIAIPYVPYTVNLPLKASDIVHTGGRPQLRAIQGKTIKVDPAAGGTAFLVLIIRAKTPELGHEIVETHWYEMSGEQRKYEFGKFTEIGVRAGDLPKSAGDKPKKWTGWDRFEMNEDE